VDKFEQQRTQDRLTVRMSREAFSPETLETMRARKEPSYLLLPEVSENGDQIQLSFDIGGMVSLNEASVQMENEALLNAVKQLTENVLDLPNIGLDITQVLTATDQMMLDKGNLRLLCLCCRESAADRAATRKALVQQIRQLIVSRSGMDDLIGFMANPYCSLEAIRGRLQKMQEASIPANGNAETVSSVSGISRSEKTPEKAVPEPVKPEPAQVSEVIPEPVQEEPEESTPSVSRPFKPEFFTPMNAGQAVPTGDVSGQNPYPQEPPASGPETTPTADPRQLFVPMGGDRNGSGSGMPFVSMEPRFTNRTAPASHAAEQESEARPASVPARKVHAGIDEATIYDDPPSRPAAPAVRPSGMDEPTVDDGNYRTRQVQTGGMDDPTVDDSARPLKSQNSGKGRKQSEDSAPEPATGSSGAGEEKTTRKKEKEKAAKTSSALQPKINADPKKAFWESLTKLAVYAAVTAILAILVGAFLGGTGIILVLLGAAIGLAFLFSRGYLTLKWPKKPETAIEQPTAPNVEEIFTVRLRMISQNLATHQEVIIRENNQIIGSDPSICRSPVSYRGISRKHCQISCKRTGGHEEYFITDLGSTNGTQLNGERLKPDMAYPLKVGDHVTLAGKYDFKISSDAY